MTSETPHQPDEATPRPDEPTPTVLQTLGERTGLAPKVLLRDEESSAGNSPVIDASARAGLVAAGRSQYQVLGQIAKGGMGVVLKSHDSDLGRDVAMKVLLEQHADKPEILQRFVEEAQIGGQLQHPGIVPVYELGLMADERPFFTMKLVKGRTLAALLADRRGEPGERRRFLTVFEQICQTMAYAHSRKVIHRDLKPANIMVGAFGEVQVVDWGLAKVLTEGGIADERAAARDAERARSEVSIIETLRSTGSSAGTESLAGSVMGTPAYMPPEQARGDIERVDERADVFGLGAILCEILTGRAPYVGEHDKVIVEAARALQDGARERLASCGADPALRDLVERCLSPNREVRPRHAGLLVEELGRWLAEQEQRARDAELAEARAVHERRARRLTLALAATVVVALLGGGLAWLWYSGGVAERRDALVRDVDGLLAEAQLLRGRTSFGEARELLGTAEVLVAASPEADGRLRSLVAQRVAEVDLELASAEAEAEWLQRRQVLLEEIERRTSESLFTGRDKSREATQAYSAMFAEVGFDLEGDLDAGLQRLREVGQDALIGEALDDWSRHALQVSGLGGEFRPLVEVAMRVDPDPARTEIREALLNNDRRVFERLASSPEAHATWSPTTLLTFSVPLYLLGQKIDVDSLKHAVHLRHPTDARLNHAMALDNLWFRSEEDRDPLRGLHHASAAHTARPDDLGMALTYARALALNGLVDEAVATVVRVIKQHPEHERVTSRRGINYAVNTLESGDLGVGQMGVFEALAALDPDDFGNLNNWAWMLLNAPDAGAADHARALELALQSIQLGGDSADVSWNTLATAAWLTGDMLTTRDAAQESIRILDGEFAMDFGLLAVALDALGDAQGAREALADMQAAPEGFSEPVDFELAAVLRERFGVEAP